MSVDSTDEQRSTQSTSSGSFDSELLDSIQRSLSLQVALVGLLVTAVAYIVNTGVWPAIIGVWGMAFVLIGVGSHLAIRYSQRSSRD